MDSANPPVGVRGLTLAVIVNGIAVAEKKYTNSLGLMAVFTLALQFFTGLYLFVLAVCREVAQRATHRLNRMADLMCTWRLST
jgi:hypothetical protein